MTNAERLLHKCPKCAAKPGDKCRQYTGEALKTPHKVRGPGQEAKALLDAEQRRVERQKAQYGPLFQEIAEQEVKARSLEEIALAKRYAAAKAAEVSSLCGKANSGIEWVRLRWLQHCLPAIVGQEFGEAIWEYAERVYMGKKDYINSFISQCLTQDKPRALRHEVRYDEAKINKYNTDGRYLVDSLVWAPGQPVMTDAEYKQRFPKLDHANGVAVDDEPDDGGLFERMMATLCGGV